MELHMRTREEIQRYLEHLPATEREQILIWILETGGIGYGVAEPASGYGAALEHHHLSVEDYLKQEETSPIKHEYVAGEIFAMSGVTLRHNRISQNLSNAFSNHLRGGPCQSFTTDVKLRLKIGRDEIFYYPDVMVACGQLNMEENSLRTPKLIVEVLSPSTETIDRREKALNYRQSPSLEEYVLVAQRMCEITIYRRSVDWEPIVLAAGESVAEFKSIELSLAVGRVYEGVV